MDLQHIAYSVEKHVATVTLQQPKRHNAIDGRVITELLSVFTQIQKDSSVKVVLLNASGDSFCGGVDIEYLRQTLPQDFSQHLEDASETMRLLLQVYMLRKPVIALVQGPALGYGCGLTTVCDFVFAAKETATFGFPDVHHGLIPSVSLIFLIRKIGEGKARELVLSGTPISATEAQTLGLATTVVPKAELQEAAFKFARQLCTSNSVSAMGLLKELMARIHGMSTTDALDYAQNLHALVRMTDDSKKGVEAFLAGKTPEWEKL